MAYTRIHAIKATVQKSVDYICNPDKTEGELLVSSFSCSPKYAGYEFKAALSETKSSDKIKAYHLIQSFAPGEVTPEEAHKIGIELADRLLEGKYSYVIATHNDRKHPHNHLIFCAADNYEHKKYNDCLKSYYHIRELSDRLCFEHDLSIIQPSKKCRRSYGEWKADREGRSWKTKMRRDIDEAVKAAESYEKFLSLIREKGYEVKGEGLGENALKYISFRAPGQQRFVRGSARSLGEKYTRDSIIRRISDREINTKKAIKTIRPHNPDILKRTAPKAKLIDTSGDRFKNSPGLAHWAEIQNLKTAAASYAEAGNLTELMEKINAKTAEANAARTELAVIGKQLKELREIQHYLKDYKDNRPFKIRYEKSKDPDRYFRMHEMQLILFDGAKDQLKKIGITPKMEELDQVNADIKALEKHESDLEKKYAEAKKSAGDLEQKYRNITEYLGLDKDSRDPEQTYENDKREKRNHGVR